MLSVPSYIAIIWQPIERKCDMSTNNEKPSLSSERQTERDEVLAKAKAAKEVSQSLLLNTEQKNTLLEAVAQALEEQSESIISANEKDIQAGKERGFDKALLDRLALDEGRIQGIAGGLRQVIALPDPVGGVIRGHTLPNGLQLTQVRTPLGVMGMVYEARPNVTVDAFGLAIKSGNVPLLRGSRSAENTNRELVNIMQDIAQKQGYPAEIVQLLPCATHDSVQDLITARGLVDVVIPRGGAALIEAVVTKATVPTIETGTGNCHFYVDASADVDEAIALVLNGKTRRCSVCNATETVIVDKNLPNSEQLRIFQALQKAGVQIHGDSEQLGACGLTDIIPAMDKDWEEEYLSLDIAAVLVDGVAEAVEHIRRYSSGHTEGIAATDTRICDYFAAHVDAAAVMINTATSWTDGEMFGFGAEIGISTQKLHARGPMGLPELTSSKWIVRGQGQTRP